MMEFRQFKEGQQKDAQFHKSLECEEEGESFHQPLLVRVHDIGWQIVCQ